MNGQWETYRGRVAPINYLFQSGDRFDIAAHPDGDRLIAPFASKRRVSGTLQYQGGGFYNGRLNQYIGSLQLKPSPLFIVELSEERDQGKEFKSNELSMKLQYALRY